MDGNNFFIINEHGYFDFIGSGREFQFFSAHFISKSRTDTKVGALDRYTLPTYEIIIEKSCNFFQKIFEAPKLALFKILDQEKWQISEIS